MKANLKIEKKVFGFTTMVSLLILLVLTICTFNGQKLMLVTQTLGKPTDCSLYSGKHARRTKGLMECAILKIVDQDSHLWRQEKLLIKQLLVQMHDSEYCPNLDQTPRKCSQIKLYQYQSIIHSFLNQYRTGWTDQRPSLRTESPLLNLQDGTLLAPTNLRNSMDWIQP